ncbi:MAG: WG repeat-containing protein [Clostridia bacterium]|nr:WG repeat-containing protein [Clostridia bacterium]
MKKNFTRIVCLALALIMVALCCACGGNEESSEEENYDPVIAPLNETMTEPAYVGPGIASFKDSQSGKLGLMDSSGSVIVNAEYAAVKYCAMEGYCILTKENGSEVSYNPEDKTLTDGNLCAHGGPAEFFWDSDNNKVVYYEIEASDVPEEDLPAENEAQIVYDMKTLKVGLIGHDGKLIVEPVYDEGLHFTNGLAAVKQNGKWGYINASGEVVIGFYYDDAYTSVACTSFGKGMPYNADKDGMVALNHDGLCGVYNRAGDIMGSFQYRDIISFGDGSFIVMKTDGSWWLANIGGVVVG